MARGFLSLGVVAAAEVVVVVEVGLLRLLGPLNEVPHPDAGLFVVGFLSFLRAASRLLPCVDWL